MDCVIPLATGSCWGALGGGEIQELLSGGRGASGREIQGLLSRGRGEIQELLSRGRGGSGEIFRNCCPGGWAGSESFLLQVEELRKVPSTSTKAIEDATAKRELLTKAKDKEEVKLRQVLASLQEETKGIQKEKEVIYSGINCSQPFPHSELMVS